MTVDVLVPLVAVACFGLVAPWVARRLPPAQGTWLLTGGGLASAGSMTAALALVGWGLVGQVPAVAREGNWSATVVRQGESVNRVLAAAALALLAAAVAAGCVVVVRRTRAVLAARSACRRLPAAVGELVVVTDPLAGAFAVPGRPGRIVVSRALLAELTPAQQRALLAHERSHLAHHHHWHRSAVALAAAVNPLLWRLPGAVAEAIERWADEDAATHARSRAMTADALLVAAAFSRQAPPAAAMAAAYGAVERRVEALRGAPPRPRPLLLLLALAVVAAAWVGVGEGVHDTAQLLLLALRAGS